MKKAVVVGLGNIATRHRRNLKKLFPGILVFAVSSSERVLSELVDDCDGYFPDIQNAVSEGLDLAIVASPSTYHFKHAQKLIEAGIPTLIEKPVTATLADAKSLIELSSKHETPVSIGYCLRYIPSAIMFKKLIEHDSVGNIYNVNIDIGQFLPDWRPTKSYRESVSASKALGGGVLLELSHELDYAQWLFGELNIVNSILRSSRELLMDVESIADITAINNNQTVVNIHMDFLQKKTWRQCNIIGSEGRLTWDLIQNEIIKYTKNNKEIIYSDPDWDSNEMYLDMLLDFVSKSTGLLNECVTLDVAVKTVELIEEIKTNSLYIGCAK